MKTAKFRTNKEIRTGSISQDSFIVITDEQVRKHAYAVAGFVRCESIEDLVHNGVPGLLIRSLPDGNKPQDVIFVPWHSISFSCPEPGSIGSVATAPTVASAKGEKKA
jgi:hypothetical protein